MVGVLSIAFLLLLSASGSVLIGEYKFWDYYGPTVDDHSGNSNHGIPDSIPDSLEIPILTDRGIYIPNSFFIQFPKNQHNEFPANYEDMLFSVLFYPTQGDLCLFSFTLSNEIYEICFIDNQGVISIQIRGSSINLTQEVTADFNTWKLFSVRLTQIGTDIHITAYLDGDDSNPLMNVILTGLKLNDVNSSWMFGTSSGSFQGFLYQIWWHGSVSTTIRSLTQELFGSPDQDCSTFYLFTPIKKCIAILEDPYKNDQGVACNSYCLSIKESCRSDGSCIPSSPPTIPCPTRCKDCIRDTEYCFLCNQGYHLEDPEDGTCIFDVPFCTALDSSYNCASCDSGYYLNSNSPPTCDVCPDGCLNCTYNSGIFECNQCPAGSHIQPYQSARLCDTTCPAEYSTNLANSPNRCEQCPQNCATCSYDSTSRTFGCSSCPPGSYLHQTTCVASCPPYTYLSTSNCVNCLSGCEHCTVSSTCTQCGPGLYPTRVDCQLCLGLSNYIYDTEYPGIPIIVPCNRCSNGDCTQCSPGFDLIGSECHGTIFHCINYDSAGTCVGCKEGYSVVTNSCIICIPNCKTCPDTSTCTECMSGYELIDGTKCAPVCKNSYHREGDGYCKITDGIITICRNPNSVVSCTEYSDSQLTSLGVTTNCASDCYFCYTSSSENLCSFCKAGFYLKYDKTGCVASCGDGFYQDTTIYECIPCSVTDCKDCLASAQECKQCIDPLYVMPTKLECILSCPFEHFNDTINGILSCSKCISNCKTCSSASDCQVCLDTYYLHNPTLDEFSCVELCPIRYEEDSSFHCIQCPPACDICENSTKCSICSVGYYLQPDFSCFEFKCYPMSVHCYLESNMIHSYNCQASYYLQPVPVICESSCPLYYYKQDSPLSKCMPCPPGCPKCDVSECFECDRGFYLLRNPPELTQSCRECPENCESCKYLDDKVICDSCKLGYYLQPEGKLLGCEASCPEGYHKDLLERLCKPCLIGFYAIEELCTPCVAPCIECKTLTKCSKCIENAIVEFEACNCDSNFEFTSGICSEVFMKPNFAIIRNTLYISFLEPIISPLSSTDIELIVDGFSYSPDQFYLKSFPGLLSFEITSEVFKIEASRYFSIKFIDPNNIIDIYKHHLDADTYTIENTNSIPQDPEDSYEEEDEDEDEYEDEDEDEDENEEEKEEEEEEEAMALIQTQKQDAKATATSTAGGASGASAGVSMVSFNLSVAWSLLNTIQVFSFIPLLNIKLPPRTFGVCQAFSSMNIMVNFFSYFIKESGPAPKGKLKEAGYETGQFLLNAGQTISILAVICVIYLVVFLLSLCVNQRYESSWFGQYLKKLLKKMKWNIFIRFLIEAYLDLVLNAFVNLLYVISI